MKIVGISVHKIGEASEALMFLGISEKAIFDQGGLASNLGIEILLKSRYHLQFPD